MCDAYLDRLDGGFPDPGKLGRHPLEPELLLAGAEQHLRRRAVIASAARRGGDENGDEEERDEGDNDWAARSHGYQLPENCSSLGLEEEEALMLF